MQTEEGIDKLKNIRKKIDFEASLGKHMKMFLVVLGGRKKRWNDISL